MLTEATNTTNLVKVFSGPLKFSSLIVIEYNYVQRTDNSYIGLGILHKCSIWSMDVLLLGLLNKIITN